MGMDVYVVDLPREPQEASWLTPNAKVGYFRDCYNNYSLANWIARNIDKDARGQWGLALFTERKDINTDEWRHELLSSALRWLKEAQKLRGKVTYVGYLDGEPIKLKAKDTADYIWWLQELVKFAALVNETGSMVEVDA